jgi:hypothetical protein
MSGALPIGTLVLDPGEGATPRPLIWTVVSKRGLVAASEGCEMRATLRATGLPKGWREISNRGLARDITERFVTSAETR